MGLIVLLNTVYGYMHVGCVGFAIIVRVCCYVGKVFAWYNNRTFSGKYLYPYKLKSYTLRCIVVILHIMRVYDIGYTKVYTPHT